MRAIVDTGLQIFMRQVSKIREYLNVKPIRIIRLVFKVRELVTRNRHLKLSIFVSL